MPTPIRFDPSLERVAPGEAETRRDLVHTLRAIAEKTHADYGHAVRSVHAKSYAILEGELDIPALPPELAQGAFATPGTYSVVMRFSTNPGDVLNDAVSAPRGLAVKIIGLEGERLPGSEGAVTQDLVMANGPVFSAPDAAAFLKSLKLLAATTDRGEGSKMLLSTALRGVSAALAAAGTKSPLVTNMGGQPLTHPLGETFYSQTPLRWGEYVGKVSVAPASANLVALQDKPISLHGNPNALRQHAIDALATQGGEWEIRVQLLTDLDRMPIEDATVEWPEDASPYRTIARIRIPAQPAWNEARAARADDRLAFAPWHGLQAHQPLGSINRARRPVYADLAALRAQQNGVQIAEPGAAVGLPAGPASARGRTPGREGFRNAPQSALGLRTAAGAIGGLAAGLLVSGLIALKARRNDEASDFARLGRRITGHHGPAWLRNSDFEEEAKAHAGHLALSAASGALYGALKPGSVGPVEGGLGFGALFGALAYAAIGPALQLTPPPWRDTRENNLQHLVVHALFGVATGVITDRAARRLARSQARQQARNQRRQGR
ncbi:MAG: catalase family protein [Janthinobacterium lividum]